jgi:hypothetical protein
MALRENNGFYNNFEPSQLRMNQQLINILPCDASHFHSSAIISWESGFQASNIHMYHGEKKIKKSRKPEKNKKNRTVKKTD